MLTVIYRSKTRAEIQPKNKGSVFMQPFRQIERLLRKPEDIKNFRMELFRIAEISALAF